MALDSDVSNADSHLQVEFYNRLEGKFKDRPFVKIIVPGNDKNIIDCPVGENHKKRFPRQWLYFQMQNEGASLIGTPISDWQKESPEDINRDQVAELSIMRFQTVEQLAMASDMQLQRIGMGGIGLRIRAQEFLKNKNRKAASSEIDAMKEKHDTEMEEIKARMDALLKKFSTPSEETAGEIQVPKKRGRKPKLVSLES